MIRNMPVISASSDDTHSNGARELTTAQEAVRCIRNVIIKNAADRHAVDWIITFFTIVEDGDPAQYTSLCC
jgi:hypothetical protein